MQQLIRKNFLFIALMVLLAVVLLNPNAKAWLLKGLLSSGVFNFDAKKEAAMTTGTAFTSLSFTDKDGNRLNTGDLKGKVIFINFWATWCPPCIAEMGSVNALYNALKTDDRFIFIMADADNDPDKSKAFMSKHHYDLPVYQLAGPVPAGLFTGTLPTTLIIDADGLLVKKHEGVANYDTKEMIDFMKGLALPLSVPQQAK